MQLMRQSEGTAARRSVRLFLVDSADGITPETGEAGGTVQIIQPGATTFVNASTLVHAGSGHYYTQPAAGSFGTIGPIRLRYKSANTAEGYADLMVVPWNPYDAGSLGITQLDAAISSRSSHSTAQVWTAATRTLTGTTGFGLAADQSAVTIGTLNTYLGTVGTVGSLKTNLDKTGYGLAADQSSVTIGTVNTVPSIGSVGTVGTLGVQAQADIWGYGTRTLTGAVDLNADQSGITIGTLSTNLDKTGYDLNANQGTVTIGTLSVYAGTVGTVGTVAVVGDKTGYSLLADQSAVTIGTVNAVPAIGSVGTVGTLGGQAQADVWAYATRTLTGAVDLNADQSGVTIGTLNTYLGTVGTVLNLVGTITTVGTVNTVGDKTGYSLAADQSSVTIGTVNTVPAIGSVGTVGTLGAQAQADVWQYATRTLTGAVDLNADQSAVTVGTLNTYLGTVGTVGTVGTLKTNLDKTGYDLNADQSGVTVGTVDVYDGTVGTVNLVGTLGTQAKADVNAEVLDVVGTDTISELGVAAPSATPSLQDAVMLIYMMARNKITQTATLSQVHNDAGTVITKSTLSDDGSTFTKAEYVSG
jgi:hypothetical protein